MGKDLAGYIDLRDRGREVEKAWVDGKG